MIASRRMLTIVEGADYLSDIESANLREKRHNYSELKATMKDSDMDESYCTFLDGILEVLEPRSLEEDEDDPSYVMFLNDLKEHGDAYMVDTSAEHGLVLPIIYEVDDETPEELKRKIPKSRRHTLLRESKSLGVDGAGAKQIGTLRSGAKRMGAPKENTERRTFNREKGSSFVNVERNSDLKSLSWETENTQIPSLRILEDSSNEQSSEPSQTVDVSSLDRNCLFKSRTVKVDEVYKAYLGGLKVVGSSVFYEDGNGKRVYYEMDGQESSNDVNMHSLKTSPKRKCKTPGPSTPPLRLKTSALRQPTPTPRRPISRQSTSPPRQPTNVIAKDHNVSKASNKMPKNNGKFSSFWNGLKSVAAKPYEQTEYADLWQKVTHRKPVEVHRETRTGGYQSTPGHLGKSYLEAHPDLDCEIKKVQTDRPKVLNLLRSFFFYLLHVPHGVPRPWTNETGMSILLDSLKD